MFFFCMLLLSWIGPAYPLLAQHTFGNHYFRSTKLHVAAEKADAWADGKNAAPAILCDVDDVLIPVLAPVPEGSKRLFMVRHGEVINPVSNSAWWRLQNVIK